ncbi:2-hydroxy-6-oxonona-2,4-dienedioate hydrolase [Thermomonospora echinospora]|uniref:2-hydroxy-6-oxonona-2,4-dienedioate hydrolase n=1 Tax=Thermomonospora echinospora TaxID=1992 RepID=A0A1H6DRH6_9ACTN|nr:alpha/beta hydrolase [Thermomonospora echinospora]SEG87830.1 2-hydroxy-6-oxonona-2,4-dienedioate hydrolase [Thermomonospora echinospora]
MSLWTDLLGAEVRYVTAAGTPTRVACLGAGPPVVLLHGRGGHLETFARNLPHLAAAGRRAIAFDLLGHGLTARRPQSRYTVEDLADHALSVLDALGLAEADLVGQSLGGWTAVQLTLRAPERVRRLALIEPAGLQSESERLADATVRAAYEKGGRAYAEPTPEAVRTRLAGLLADPEDVDPELVEVRTALYLPEEAREVHRLVRAADNGRFLLTPQRLAGLDVPVLFLRGEHGHTPATVVEAARAAIPRARLLTIPGAKQWPQYERPALVNTALIDFLSKENP